MIKNIQLLISAAFILKASSYCSIAADAPQPTAIDLQTAAVVATTYRIDPQEAVRYYKMLFDPEFTTALKAVDFFSDKKAFDVLAAALPKVAESLKAPVTNAILEREHF